MQPLELLFEYTFRLTQRYYLPFLSSLNIYNYCHHYTIVRVFHFVIDLRNFLNDKSKNKKQEKRNTDET